MKPRVHATLMTVRRLVGRALIVLLSVGLLSASLTPVGRAGAARLASSLVPVIACRDLLQDGPSRFKTPHSRRVSAPASAGERLAAYQFQRVWVLAPLGWRCGGSTNASGGGVEAYPSAGPDPEAPLGVSAWFSAPGVNSDQDACFWSTNASKAARKRRIACGLIPAPPGERRTHAGPGELDFTDPPLVAGLGYPSGGRNPATGLYLFEPASSNAIKTDAAATATCTLPATERRTCTTSLNAIRAEFRRETESKHSP